MFSTRTFSRVKMLSFEHRNYSPENVVFHCQAYDRFLRYATWTSESIRMHFDRRWTGAYCESRERTKLAFGGGGVTVNLGLVEREGTVIHFTSFKVNLSFCILKKNQSFYFILRSLCSAKSLWIRRNSRGFSNNRVLFLIYSCLECFPSHFASLIFHTNCVEFFDVRSCVAYFMFEYPHSVTF